MGKKVLDNKMHHLLKGGAIEFQALLQANEPAGAGGFLLEALLANVFWDDAVAHELAESPATEADTKDGF